MTAPATATEELDNLTNIPDKDEFLGWVCGEFASLHVLFVWADFFEPSKPGGQMDTVCTKLAELNSDVEFARLNAEEVIDVSEELDVATVPTFLFFKKGCLIDRLEGADPAEFTRRVDKLKAAPFPIGATELPAVQELRQRLHALVNSSPVMLFMKGTPSEAKCKFSRKILGILEGVHATFGSFDIFTSEAVRNGLKMIHDWPTFPQLYVKGQLVGGVDITQELAESGELAAMLADANGSSAASSGSSSGMASAASSSSSTGAGSTAGGVGASAATSVTTDRSSEGACGGCGGCGGACSNSSSSGSHAVTEPAPMLAAAAVPTLPVLSPTSEAASAHGASISPKNGEPLGPKGLPLALEHRLESLIHRHKVMLFMKGSPHDPACGFSERMVDILKANGLTVFDYFDILADAQVREGLKKYSNWPTFPQLYVNGELVGGLDIIRQTIEENPGQPLPQLLGL